MTWEKEIIIKLLKFVELIGILLLFLVKIIKAVLKKAVGIVLIGIIILGLLYYLVGWLSLGF